VHGMGVMTAITIQDTARVHRVLPAFPSVVLDQLRTLLRDVVPDAVKLGMLATDDVVLNVELALRELPAAPRRVPLVIDPVLAASDGTPLLERRAWPRLQELLGRAELVTPNLFEAQALTGEDCSSEEGTQAAATVLLASFGARAALVKGGHRDGPPRDLLALREGGSVLLEWLEGERLPVGPVHGTGCALAAAVAAGLARGVELRPAVAAARAFVLEALRRAEARGKSARFLVYP